MVVWERTLIPSLGLLSACSLCVCLGSPWGAQLSPTSQRHAWEANNECWSVNLCVREWVWIVCNELMACPGCILPWPMTTRIDSSRPVTLSAGINKYWKWLDGSMLPRWLFKKKIIWGLIPGWHSNATQCLPAWWVGLQWFDHPMIPGQGTAAAFDPSPLKMMGQMGRTIFSSFGMW